MPIYDFECSDCGRFEATCRIAARDDGVACPSCGRHGTRMVAAPSVRGGSSSEPDAAEGRYGMRHMGSCLCCK